MNTSVPPAYVFPHAAVASPHYLATAAGLSVLQSGGNAVDAAVATNLVLAVVFPHGCGLGGDLFAMVYAEGKVHGLNSSGRLPKAAVLPADGRVPVRGIGSATVPGAVAGWLALLERFGTRSVGDLAKPAIRLASEGYWPSPNLERALERSREVLQDDPQLSQIFLSGGKITNPALAEVLEDLPNFYEGPAAKNAPAPFSPEDFASHEAEWVDPPSTPFADVQVYEMPPNSRGYLALEAIERLGTVTALDENDPEFHLQLIRSFDEAAPEGDTVYLCVHDENGMAVSLNESNYMGFGSGASIPGTGIHLHNRGAYCTPETYKPGERPVHTLSPAMALKDGKPKLVFGTMGGEAQIQIHLQLLARIFLLKQDPAVALEAPRWIKQMGALVAEEGLPEIGARVIPRSDAAGHAHVILSTDKGLAAASDPRTDGLAAGY
ncbi:MAG TPA: gamma-glutamyltransferase [Actinomycetota bacterium]|nr:gamma-glutamyltransferase [Actinomycetota bacterium]